MQLKIKIYYFFAPDWINIRRCSYFTYVTPVNYVQLNMNERQTPLNTVYYTK